MSLCECGCGQEVKKDRRFVVGHNFRLQCSRDQVIDKINKFYKSGIDSVNKEEFGGRRYQRN